VIRLTDNRPYAQPAYRIPDALQAEVDQQIGELLENGIIVESDSEYASPLIPVQKKSGKLRLVCNFKQVNAKTIPDQYPMPNPADILNRAAGAKFISSIDLTSA
jgi:hypothetical protein